MNGLHSDLLLDLTCRLGMDEHDKIPVKETGTSLCEHKRCLNTRIWKRWSRDDGTIVLLA
jgi:hypothetical protein